MKKIFTLIMLLVSVSAFGQNLEEGGLWRTRGVYDSLGNFIERAKIQSFLSSSKSGQFYRLATEDQINMETGETTVFVYRDTVSLVSLGDMAYKLNDQEVLTFHSNDSLTIKFNGFTLPYVRMSLSASKVKMGKLKSELINKPLVESVSDVKEYSYNYQDNGLMKIKPLKGGSEWESDYELIDFNGFIIIQGIVSAPKLVTKCKKGKISFIEMDYRFESKSGELNK